MWGGCRKRWRGLERPLPLVSFDRGMRLVERLSEPALPLCLDAQVDLEKGIAMDGTNGVDKSRVLRWCNTHVRAVLSCRRMREKNSRRP